MGRDGERAQILVGATILVMILLIFVPMMVQWGRREASWSVKEQKSVTAFNIAEAAIDRGAWKLKQTTSTWQDASLGIVQAGYNFDVVYADIEGGRYRLKFSSGPQPNQVTVLAEGVDGRTHQVRAIQAVFRNVISSGALIAGGAINYQGNFEVHWGSVYSQNNINLGGWALTSYFPRKFSKQVVTPRDANGLTPPNTDNLEWWSNYNVPDMPLLDFVTMRATASATGTLNLYTGNGAAGGAGKCTGWAGHNRCSSAGVTQASHNGLNHFFDSEHHAQSKNNRTWYWDGDVNFTGTNAGGGCHGMGIWGTVIVRGNLTMDSPEDCYGFTNTNVPSDAWVEYQKIDTAGASDEYPADNGYHANDTSYVHGGAGSGWPGGHPDAKTDVGLRGFLYTGGNMTINKCSDVAGAAWVVGNITNNAVGDRVVIFYNPSDVTPAVLNVVLIRVSWDEVPPSSTAW